MKIMKAIRNIGMVGLLWVGASVTAPVSVYAGCWPPDQLDSQNWANSCAPGGVDACGYFRSECDYYCFTQYSGALCSSNLEFCSQYQSGSESDPVWCLNSGYCNCYWTNG